MCAGGEEGNYLRIRRLLLHMPRCGWMRQIVLPPPVLLVAASPGRWSRNETFSTRRTVSTTNPNLYSAMSVCVPRSSDSLHMGRRMGMLASPAATATVALPGSTAVWRL